MDARTDAKAALAGPRDRVPTGGRGGRLQGRGWCLTGLWRQGAGPGELLADFDAVRATHEAMDPEAFNDDGTYKGGINQVRRVPCSEGTLAHAHVCHRCPKHLRGDEGLRPGAQSSRWRRG
jgi:hypothetical protein